MNPEKRPLGVTALSLIAFIVSPSLATLAIYAIPLIVRGRDVPGLVSVMSLILFDSV